VACRGFINEDKPMSHTNLNKKSSNEKTTIYLDPKIKKSVRYYAVRDDKSMSEIINQKLFEYLEEQDDIATYREAKAEYETDGKLHSLDGIIKELGLDINDIRYTAHNKS
jgi:hypothetical protein